MAKAEHAVAKVEQTAVKVEAAVAKVAANAEKKTGSYSIEFKNGKKYHGKGPESRMNQSAREKAENNGGVKSKEWAESANDREAFKAEHERIAGDGGVDNPNNLNRRNSPGKRYCEQDKNCKEF